MINSSARIIEFFKKIPMKGPLKLGDIREFHEWKNRREFFPVRVRFGNKTFGSETVCRLSWKKDTWKTEKTIFFHWAGNELVSFKLRSLTIQQSHSSFSRFIYVVTSREFEICSRHAIINNLHFHIFININTLFDDIWNISCWTSKLPPVSTKANISF